jgi:ketosteroid isomerase-like protein
MEFFTDDGIIFTPSPVNSKEWYRKRLPTPKPLKATLNWEPRYGDVSRAGDLGYNIGPWNYVNNSPSKEPDVHGYYMSIWRKQPDGRWKVALDFGTGGGVAANADHVFGKPFQAAQQYKIKVPSGSNPANELQRLTEMDRDFGKGAQAVATLDIYLAKFSDNAKVMRAGIPPAGKEAVRSYIPAGKDVSLALAPIGGEVAKSGDLGYTYGSYELQESGQAKEKGYYAHIWKRDGSGKWRIVVSNIEKRGK